MEKTVIKITYLVDFFRTPNAGTEKQLGYLLTYLPKAGYSVELVSLQDSDFLRREARSLFPEVSINSLGASSDISKSPMSLVRLYRILRWTRPDIVHTFFPASNSIGALISKLAGVRKIVTSRRDMGFNLTRKDIILLKLGNMVASRVLANCEAVRDRSIQLEGLRREKTAVIYNGIDAGEFYGQTKVDDNGKPVVGIVANLNRHVKRVDVFVRAASMVVRPFPDVQFLIVGDGPLREELEALASELGIGHRVKFMGRRNDVKGLLSEFTIGVISSDSEGLSNSIMEYMAAGLPVVATSVGGNPELVINNETGVLFPPGDAEALAKSILRLLDNRQTSKEMGERGRSTLLLKSSIQGMVEETRSLYEGLIGCARSLASVPEQAVS